MMLTLLKRFGYAPPYQAAESSAALLVFKDAFERANSFDTKKVRDALAATDMQTFYGNIKFAEGGQNVSKPMVLVPSNHVTMMVLSVKTKLLLLLNGLLLS